MHCLRLGVLAIVMGAMLGETSGWADERTARRGSKRSLPKLTGCWSRTSNVKLRMIQAVECFRTFLPMIPAIGVALGQLRRNLSRVLLNAGACHGNTTALRKLFALEHMDYGLGFNEVEVLFLQRLSKTKKLNLPFHDRYRRKRKYFENVSEEPQLVMQMNWAFDKGNVDRALKLVRRFQKIYS